MKELKNIDHTFDIEVGHIGCTIRKGSKWSQVDVGEKLVLMNCDKGHAGECGGGCHDSGTGIVIGSWLGEYGDLPEGLISIEHNKEARNPETLREMMKVGYGDIDDKDIVTALVYLRTHVQ